MCRPSVARRCGVRKRKAARKSRHTPNYTNRTTNKHKTPVRVILDRTILQQTYRRFDRYSGRFDYFIATKWKRCVRYCFLNLTRKNGTGSVCVTAVNYTKKYNHNPYNLKYTKLKKQKH